MGGGTKEREATWVRRAMGLALSVTESCYRGARARLVVDKGKWSNGEGGGVGLGAGLQKRKVITTRAWQEDGNDSLL